MGTGDEAAKVQRGEQRLDHAAEGVGRPRRRARAGRALRAGEFTDTAYGLYLSLFLTFVAVGAVDDEPLWVVERL